MSALVLLVLHAVGAWTYSALGLAAAIAAAVLVVAVSIFSARWFIVPALVFIALPLAARLWTLFAVEQSWWTRFVEFAPFLIGFGAPVLLLLAAYLELSRRARGNLEAAAPQGVLAGELRT